MTKEGDPTKVEFSGTQRKPNKRTPSLVRALTKVFWLNIVLAALFKIANDIVRDRAGGGAGGALAPPLFWLLMLEH